MEIMDEWASFNINRVVGMVSGRMGVLSISNRLEGYFRVISGILGIHEGFRYVWLIVVVWDSGIWESGAWECIW